MLDFVINILINRFTLAVFDVCKKVIPVILLILIFLSIFFFQLPDPEIPYY